MGTSSFGTLNWIILGTYLGAVMAIGFGLTRRQKTSDDYFLAGRNMPWIIVGMSMFASMTSAISYMGMPGTAVKEDISILAGYYLSPVVAPFVILMFYPLYRRLNVTTSYEYIFRRYGASARYGVSALFVLARLGWLGAVIYAPALVLSIMTGMSVYLAILILGVIATLYTVAGGLKAVVLTDAIQFVVLVSGAIMVAVSLSWNVDGGVSGIFRTAAATGHLVNWHVSFFEACALAFSVSYFFSLMQDYGCDQVAVQRLLASKSYAGMARAAVFNSLVDVFMFSLLAFVGLGLFAYYRQFPAEGVDGDRLLPHYMIHALPAGISGLAIAGIFVAAIASGGAGIHSMSTVLVNDFVRPLWPREIASASEVRLGRMFTALIGTFGTCVAFYVSSIEQVLKAACMILGLFNGPILALFVLGVLTTRTNFRGWLFGAAAGLAATLLVMNVPIAGHKLHWAYFMPCSVLTSAVVSYGASILLGGKAADIDLTVWRPGRK
jgi:SSS family solute:Na+ symporter